MAVAPYFWTYVSDHPDILRYQPHALTVSFYDTATSTYGFTWNANKESKSMVLQICEGNNFDKNSCVEYSANVSIENTYKDDLKMEEYYVSKTQVYLR